MAELATTEYEASVSEISQREGLIAGFSKSTNIQAEKLEEIQMSLRQELMTDLSKCLAENQKELMKLSTFL